MRFYLKPSGSSISNVRLPIFSNSMGIVMNLLRSKRVWLALVAVAALVAMHFSGITQYLTLETLRANRAELTAFVASHLLLSAALYTLIYIAAVAFSLPGAVLLTLTGGFLFGTVAGSTLTVLGATIGATLIFLLAKAILGEQALDRLGPQGATLTQNIKKNAWSYLLVLRLVPLFPFFLVNLAPAFAGVGLKTFVLTTFIGIIPGTVVFSLAGAGIDDALAREGAISISSILTPEIIAGLVGLAVLSLAAIPLRRKFERADDGVIAASELKPSLRSSTIPPA